MATVEYGSSAPEGSGTRSYRSPRRQMQAAQTRAAALEAAARLFAERGWTGTAMRDVARAAQVSVETLYAAFGSKARLLKSAVEAAVVGDDVQKALAERPAYKAIGEGRTVGARIEAAAHMVAVINERLHPLAAALRHGATTDPVLATAIADLDAQRRSSVTDAAEMITGHRSDPERIDELWVQTDDQVYALFVHHCGWSRARYEAWLIDRIEHILGPV
ncbi:TetR/AcrR family transcriptional regulator [Rhodococcus sp. B50]|uniref:TetR/AcrR family transcriptional regulator n=1 Tax=Rhodococcus sp. B50 TaxID=2682847 RepID=UPI001BD40CA7|nr:TetR family transcriptional regulator [Rhodococcus sp. B50]